MRVASGEMQMLYTAAETKFKVSYWLGENIYKMYNWPERFRIQNKEILDFPCSSGGKESTCNAEDTSQMPGLGRSTGEGIGYPLYSDLKNSMDYLIHGIAKSQT